MSSGSTNNETPLVMSKPLPIETKKFWKNNQLSLTLPTLPVKPLELVGTRVNQLDSNLLDGELSELLKSKLLEATKLFKTDIQTFYLPEIQLLLSSVLFCLSVLGDYQASYGQMLLNLKYVTSEGSGVKKPDTWRLALYGAITLGGPYVISRSHQYLLSSDWYNEPSESETDPSNLKLKFKRILATLEKYSKLISLIHFLSFLTNGRYYGLVERLLGLKLVPSRRGEVRNTNYEFLSRQLVWDGFSEFLLYVAPMVRLTSLTSTLKSFTSKFIRSSNTTQYPIEVLSKLSPKICAYCFYNKNLKEDQSNIDSDNQSDEGKRDSCDVQLAHQTECGHIFCYFCLHKATTTDPDPKCPRCDSNIKDFKRVSNVIVMPIPVTSEE